MLYTSENSSLAYLENLVHFDDTEYPPKLYLMKIEVDSKASIYTLKDSEYPADWQQLELLENKTIGNRLMNEKKALAIKTKSAINPAEYNFLLNPLFPRFYDLVKVIEHTEIELDERLIRRQR